MRIAWRDALPAGPAGVAAGVLRELWELDAVPRGGGVAVALTRPEGAASNGSGAAAVVLARAFSALARAPLAARRLAGVAFRGERRHAGAVRSLDEYMCAALAHPGRALLLECASLVTRQVPLRARLLVVETGVAHDAAGAAAAERRAECQQALVRLQVELPELVWLASWPARWLARLKKALSEPQRGRAVHVVSETARVRYAAALLERRRLARVGEVMYESHESCRRYFACSAPELDVVVGAARRGGALGAALTGPGWGGSVVVLVGGERERGVAAREARVAAAVTRAFKRAYGRVPQIRAVRPGGGPRVRWI
jgi:galactokinase